MQRETKLLFILLTLAAVSGCDATEDGSLDPDVLGVSSDEALRSARTVGAVIAALPVNEIPDDLLELDPEMAVEVVLHDDPARGGQNDVLTALVPDSNAAEFPLPPLGTCTTGAITNPTHGAVIPYAGLAEAVTTSPDNGYGETWCIGRFVTEVTGVAHQGFDFIARGVAPTAYPCENTVVSAIVYGRRLPQLGASWVTLGRAELQGTWTNTLFGPQCVWHPGPGSGSLPTISNASYSKVRIAAKATAAHRYPYFTLYFPARVTAGVVGDQGEP